jgi:hypothetical protein
VKAAVIVHFDEQGEINYRVIGGEDVRLFIVDERAPHDRVYEWLPRDDVSVFRGIIPEGVEIGSNSDARHAATAALINAAQEGKPHLTIVDGDRP